MSKKTSRKLRHVPSLYHCTANLYFLENDSGKSETNGTPEEDAGGSCLSKGNTYTNLHALLKDVTAYEDTKQIQDGDDEDDGTNFLVCVRRHTANMTYDGT